MNKQKTVEVLKFSLVTLSPLLFLGILLGIVSKDENLFGILAILFASTFAIKYVAYSRPKFIFLLPLIFSFLTLALIFFLLLRYTISGPGEEKLYAGLLIILYIPVVSVTAISFWESAFKKPQPPNA